jgi:hypothetical protein
MEKNRFLNTQSWLTGAVIILSISIGALLMASLTALAAPGGSVTRRVAVEPFSALNTSAAIEVVFTQGEAPGYAEIKGTETDIADVDLRVINGVLTIGYRTASHRHNSTKTVVTVTNPVLESVQLSSAATLNVMGALLLNTPLTVRAESAASANFGEIAGPSLTVDASSAAKVYALVVEMDNVRVTASSASEVRLKGMSVASVEANAESAADVVLAGRCNKSDTGSSGGGEVKTRGLIVENLPITRHPVKVNYELRNP